MTKIVPVLLAGGAGTRLWPVSRDALPKQFLPLVGERSSYQETLLRVRNPELFDPPIVVTGANFRFFREAAGGGFGRRRHRRDRAGAPRFRPSGAAAAILAKRRDPSAVVLALAADHIILDVNAFHKACLAGLEAVQAGRIVTFGIKPTEPKTSYGYIRRGKPAGPKDVYAVEAFVEKPDAATAGRYVAEGYLWNSGNFLFRADVLLEELQRYKPAIAKSRRRGDHRRKGRYRISAPGSGLFRKRAADSRSTMR